MGRPKLKKLKEANSNAGWPKEFGSFLLYAYKLACKMFGTDVAGELARLYGEAGESFYSLDFSKAFKANSETEMHEEVYQMFDAVCKWSLTRGVYRIDPSLEKFLVESADLEAVPFEAFDFAPERVVAMSFNRPIPFVGFLASNVIVTPLRYENGSKELVLDFFRTDTPKWARVNVPMDSARIEDIEEALLGEYDGPHNEEMARSSFENAKPIINMYLYLCAKNRDIIQDSSSLPYPNLFNPVTKKLEKKPTEFRVGSRVGPALAKTICAGQKLSGFAEQTKRPHVRRAHWHHYWTGPREGERSLVVRWVHPVLVGVAKGELDAVDREVCA